MLTDHAAWVAFGAILLVLLLAGLITATAAGRLTWSAGESRRFGRRRPPREHFRPEGAVARQPVVLRRAALVVNPTKFADTDAVRAQMTAVCVEQGWAEPLWLETTVDDPGTGQARHAVEQGVTIVCALGGDGTVRAVAAALVGTETPIGLLPGGTGNLLARNLQLPVDNVETALRLALSGQNKRVDVGRITITASITGPDTPSGTPDQPKDHIFLVMAGLGFDAAIMAGAPERLKKHLGWVAYSVSGLKNLRGVRFRVSLTVDDEPPFSRRVRTVVIGNCGRLTGGLVLLPEAEVDDGWLDAVLLSPQGLVGWVPVAARLITRRRKGHERVDHYRVKSMLVTADRPEQVQLDGDPIGEAIALSVQVQPNALLVRVY